MLPFYNKVCDYKIIYRDVSEIKLKQKLSHKTQLPISKLHLLSKLNKKQIQFDKRFHFFGTPLIYFAKKKINQNLDVHHLIKGHFE